VTGVTADRETVEESLADYLRRQAGKSASLGDETGRLSQRQLLPGSTQLVLSQIPASGTLEEAMRVVAEAYNVLHGGAFNKVERREGTVAFMTDDRDFPFAVDGTRVFFVMEVTLLFAHALLRLIAPAVAAEALRGVSLRRPEAPAAVPFDKMAPVRFGADIYALRYDEAEASKRVTFPPRSALSFQAVTEEQLAILAALDGAGAHAAAVRSALLGGAPDQAAVCERLGLSPATLRRRLSEEGTCFRTLRKLVLNEQAHSLLGTALPLTEIASRLGFSDVRSFNRAYYAWNGMTPHQARLAEGRAAL
jgi:AraC-like DNA-binding protein